MLIVNLGYKLTCLICPLGQENPWPKDEKKKEKKIAKIFGKDGFIMEVMAGKSKVVLGCWPWVGHVAHPLKSQPPLFKAKDTGHTRLIDYANLIFNTMTLQPYSWCWVCTRGFLTSGTFLLEKYYDDLDGNLLQGTRASQCQK